MLWVKFDQTVDTRGLRGSGGIKKKKTKATEGVLSVGPSSSEWNPRVGKIAGWQMPNLSLSRAA